MAIRKCIMCKAKIQGRSDKKFCSVKCRSDYHIKLRKVTEDATHEIDKILHRNRSILLEVLGKNGQTKKINRRYLDKKNFRFDYLTGYHLNSQNKMVHYIYDFTWSIFSDQEILIKRLKS